MNCSKDGKRLEDGEGFQLVTEGTIKIVEKGDIKIETQTNVKAVAFCKEHSVKVNFPEKKPEQKKQEKKAENKKEEKKPKETKQPPNLNKTEKTVDGREKKK